MRWSNRYTIRDPGNGGKNRTELTLEEIMNETSPELRHQSKIQKVLVIMMFDMAQRCCNDTTLN